MEPPQFLIFSKNLCYLLLMSGSVLLLFTEYALRAASRSIVAPEEGASSLSGADFPGGACSTEVVPEALIQLASLIEANSVPHSPSGL